MKKSIIFDLDGTLLDTLDDILNAVNHSLKKYNLMPITKDECREFIGSGPFVLIEKSVKENKEKLGLVYEEYLSYYENHNDINTKPYEGILELLNTLKENNIRLAVVSNKQDSAVKEMVSKYFGDTFELAIGSSSNLKKKPSFDMIQLVLNSLGIDKKDCIYIGDSEIDIKTASNKMDLIMVSWGFRNKNTLFSNGAKLVVDSTKEILSIVLNK